MVCYFLLLEKDSWKSKWSKFIKEQEVFTNWTIDGMQHQKNEKWSDRQNLAFLNITKDLLY